MKSERDVQLLLAFRRESADPLSDSTDRDGTYLFRLRLGVDS